MEDKAFSEHRNVAAKLMQNVLDDKISAEEAIQRWPNYEGDELLKNALGLFYHYRDDDDIRKRDKRYAEWQTNEIRKIIKELTS